jgi:pimeloyl-ACP methyl ester carboxylesterase
MPAATFHARFTREVARAQACWSVTCKVGPLQAERDHAAWDMTMQGPDWDTEVRHLLFGWDDLIQSELKRGPLERLFKGVAAAGSFIRHGALVRYLVHGWRYALFFLYPVMVLLAAASMVGIGAHFAMQANLSAWIAWPLAAAAFWGFYRLAGRHLHLDHLIDDWIFAHRVIAGVPEPIASRVRAMAELIAREAGDDEVLVVGHSLGAVIAAELVAHLARSGGRPLRFAMIGSSILKIGLHGRAKALKATMARLADNPDVIMADIQALNDPMNFYKSKPLAALGIRGREMITRQVRFSRMLEPEAYARIRRNLFRLHCQFISGNTQRAPYDYALMLGGPFPLEVWASLPTGPMGLIGEGGELTEAGRVALRHATGPLP